MNKNGNSKAKYCIQSEKHSLQTTMGLCSLMEHQSLVDIVICCGNNTLHAHKVVLAANSPLFREELEKNACIEQVIISGCDFSVMRSIVEFMYCGETTISEDYIKYLVAAAKLFQMRSLENLSLERTDYQFEGDVVVLPRPQFLSKKPKYPAYPFNSTTTLAANNILKPLNYSINNIYKPHKVKRKFRLEAEHQACVKEAQASRMAIANLKKEIASAPQANTFIIEETCTETTVENFIPHTGQPSYVEVVDYSNIENQVFVPSNQFNQDNTKSASIIQMALQNNLQGLTADKIKNILGNEIPSNVEIMFKTSDGSFVTVTDEVLQNLSTKDGLQYQVVDENGHVGEVQELQVLGRDSLQKINKVEAESIAKDLSNSNNDLPVVTNTDDYINSHFIDSSQIIFSTPQMMDTESPHEPTDMSLNNSKNFTSAMFRDENTIDESLIPHSKEIELTLSNQDSKPVLTSSNQSEDTANNYYNLHATNDDMEPNKFNGDDTHHLEQVEVHIEDDKSKIIEISSLSPGKSRSAIKFSPDMFFADIPPEDMEEIIMNDPEKKKLCLNHRKMI